jgi:hypothetical protein
VFGGPYDRRGLGLIKPGTANRSQGQGRSSEQTRWSWGGCELALELWATWEGSLTTGQHFEPDLRNSAVRDYRGAVGNVAMVNCEPTLQTERARMETLYLRPARPRSIPIEQTVRLEHNEIAAASKTGPRKIVFVERSGKPIQSPFWEGRRHWGRTRQMHSVGPVGVWAQASQDRFAEVTSGRFRWQQGLVATCTDSSNEANSRRRGEPHRIGE